MTPSPLAKALLVVAAMMFAAMVVDGGSVRQVTQAVVGLLLAGQVFAASEGR